MKQLNTIPLFNLDTLLSLSCLEFGMIFVECSIIRREENSKLLGPCIDFFLYICTSGTFSLAVSTRKNSIKSLKKSFSI